MVAYPSFSTIVLETPLNQLVIQLTGFLIPFLILSSILDTNSRYKPPKLVRGKRWYVKFSAWDLSENRLREKRMWCPGSAKTVQEKEIWAAQVIEQITEALKSGYVFGDPAAPNKRAYTAAQALQFWLDEKGAQLRAETLKDYKTVLTIFSSYAATELGDKPVYQMQKEDILKFLSYLQRVRGCGNYTRNNYLERLASCFNFLQEWGYVTKSPCKGIKRLKVSPTKNRPFTDAEIALLMPYLRKHDAMLHLVCCVVYYCFIRITELRRMQVKHFDLINQKVFVPAKISKNHKNEHVEMPLPLAHVLRAYLPDGVDPEHYVLTVDGLPGEKMLSKNVIGNRFRRVKKQLGIHDPDKGVYSWKATGACKLYMAGCDIKQIQLQLRHSSLEITDIYLRELGMYRNGSVSDIFPPLP